MKTLTLLTSLALGVSAFGQATNTNRGPVPVPTRPIRSESTNVAPPVPAPGVPLRGAPTAPDARVTNPAAPATNIVQPAAALEVAPTNIAATVTNPAAAAATGAATTTTTTTATNRVGTTPLRAAQTNVITRPSTIPTPTPPGTRPGTPAATAAAASAAAVPTTTSPTTPITALSTNNLADDVIIPPGLIKFQETDLAHVLEFYQQLTGRTVLRPQSLPQTKITLITQAPLTRREAVQALDSILSMNQITMVPQGEKFVKAVPAAQSPTEAREFNQLPHMDIPNSGSVVAQIVQLSNAVPRDVAQALQPFAKLPNSILGIDSAGILILRDYAENVKRMMEVLAKVDVVPVQEFEPIVIPIKYALAGDIADVIGSLTSGGGGTTRVGAQQTRAGLSTGGFGGGGVGGAGGFGNQPGQTGYNPQGTTGLGTTGGGLGGAAAGRSSFANRLQQIVNRAATAGDIVVLGNTKIIADERTNSLLIFASKSDINTIRDIIEKLDVVLAQVIIEALVLEVGLNDNYQMGISYLQKPKPLGGGSQGTGSVINQPPGIPIAVQPITEIGSNAIGGFSYFATWGDWNVALQAAAGDGRISVLSRPRVQTSHAVEANLFVGETRPYPTSSQFGGVYGSYSSIQQLQIGITLSVLPLINPDGLVVMDIRQKIQDIGPSVTIQGVGEVPSTIDREANAKVAVRDGESVVLGGLISSQKTESRGGVPILKDIPVLGWLFRSSTKDANRRELMVFVRPTVLPTPEAAAIAAAAEKDKLPGISRTEYEASEAERKRLEEYELEKAHRNDEALREVQRQQKRRDAEQLRELERTQREEDRLRQEQQEKLRELMKKEGFKQ